MKEVLMMLHKNKRNVSIPQAVGATRNAAKVKKVFKRVRMFQYRKR